nr:hypothetical protein [Acidobacteriota bacterium]
SDMKLLKTLLFTSILALGATGMTALADSCSANARACRASCSISSPPGGSTACYSGFNFATCVSFDANGNQVGYQDDQCQFPW